jgi:predicted nucleotidyltransferase component of viral defense system
MSLEFSKHRSILLEILKDIYSDAAIAPYLGFKGGTAAHLFYGLNRSSVDLDFDLLDETMEAVVFEKIRKLVANYGTVKDSYMKRFNLLNVISYAPGAPQIKIEINRRNIGSRYSSRILLGISMKVMVEEDMFANKLMAMYERMGKTSRDIYDVDFFAKKHWEINEELIEKRLGMSLKELLGRCVTSLEEMDNRRILVGLGELLTEAQKNWVRAKLKEETIFLLNLRISVIP